MPRFRFSLDHMYVGRLCTVFRRPIENAGSDLAVLRLEFEVYIPKNGKLLQTYGYIACREIVIGRSVRARQDANIVRYADLLRLPSDRINDPESWLALQPASRTARGQRWIGIRFGKPTKVDYRQPFDEISQFSVAGWKVAKFPFPRDEEWVRIGRAAEFLGVSESTARRRIASYVKDFDDLVRRTDGNQRLVNIRLLAHLLDAEKWLPR